MEGIEAVYGQCRGALGSLTTRSRRSNGGVSSPLSLTLDPFVWDDGDNRGGGAWVSPRTLPLADECDGVQEITTSPVLSPRCGSPSGVRNIMLSAKDKEALLEEVVWLKRALHDQDFLLRRDRVYASAVQLENRKLEYDIKDLEMQGSVDNAKSPRGTRSIRTKLKGRNR